MSGLTNERIVAPDEETPLLSTPPKITPLPMLQYMILLLMMLSEPISFTSINPYIKQLIGSLDITSGDERRVGYYTGLLMSLFFAGEATTTLQWSRLSDRMGRKPVLLFGLACLCLTMLLFGLSRTFISLVISRCLAGMLNGNSGLMKTMFAEMTDSTNRAQAFALMPVTFSIGVAIGPFIGGSLEHPQTKFPSLFPQHFWKKFPYFLPCAVTAAFTAATWIIGAIWLKETLPKKHRVEGCETYKDETDKGEAVPLRSLLTFPIILSISNYGLVSFIAIVLVVVHPIFYASSIVNGGLGLSPRTIGSILGAWGLFNGLFQVFFFAPIIKRLGERTLFLTSLACYVPIYALCPVMNLLATKAGHVSAHVWLAIVTQLLLMSFADMTWGSIFMFMISAAPNPRSLGATNGLAQSLASIVRTIGPAVGAGLFSLSVEHNLMDGYAIYFVMIVLTGAAWCLGTKLPRRPWNNGK